MSRQVPMAACLSLLKSFDTDNPTPQQAIAGAAAWLEQTLSAEALADLNDGQFAAMIDLVLWKGGDFFEISTFRSWIEGGNLTLPVAALTFLGPRGVAERIAWNIGNSA